MNKISKLGLGTVQWGLSYGVSNQSGPTTPEMVTSILLDARRSGVSVLDTGSLYGNAEMVLGMNSLERFHVVTKTPQFATSRITTIETNQLKQAFQKSLDTLSCKKFMGFWCTMLKIFSFQVGMKLCRR